MLLIRTHPHHRPSIRVAEKLGFQFVGPGNEPDMVGYALDRAGWKSKNTV
jgi:RimJ/RimL family protein N-acetyltransferase